MMNRSKAYRTLRHVVSATFLAYLVTIYCPQYLFGHEITYQKFRVYSQAPIDPHIDKVLDDAERRLASSTIYNGGVRRRVFLTSNHVMYAFLSNKAYASFANSVPFVDNMIINKSDVAKNLVFLNRPQHNRRSLSGVIAHEVTHLFIRKKVGTLRASRLPVWKNEGYCEYIARDSTITDDEGVKLWRENPRDDSKYRYFKYHMMIKYLLETEKLSIEDIFKRDFDTENLGDKVLRNLCPRACRG
jgi:hypothetical protein